MAYTKYIFIDQGTTYTLSLTATDSAGSPINLSGCSISAQLRKSPAASNYTSFSTSITGSTGQFILTLAATASSAISSGKYMYDVELTNSSGIISRIVQGTALIDPEITK